MKKTCFFLLSLMCFISSSAQDILVGDMNGDNALTISDVTELVNVVTNKSEKQFVYSAEAFIKENTLTGTFKINGIEKHYENGVLDPYNGHEYVDLGLSVKWATTNVGASRPEYSGYYFSWADASRKKRFYWDTYPYCNGTYDVITKYFSNEKYGVPDYMIHVKSTDDAASVSWGGNWRIPSKEEMEELINNCYFQNTPDYNGSKMFGCIVYKAKNEADKGLYNVASVSSKYSLSDPHIFFPAVGYMKGYGLYGNDTYGCYWTNMLYSEDQTMAYYMSIFSGYLELIPEYRCCGLPIRAVCP